MQRKLWKIKEIDQSIENFAQQNKLSIILAHLLKIREISQEEIKAFLDPVLDNLHSPLLLPDIEKAVERIKLAVSKREKVLVFGDYDVDGVTSLAIFNEFAKDYSEVFSFYIPHRVNEGYGLNKEAIIQAKNDEVSLIIAFDCGTNATEEFLLASSLGIDIIVIDHHVPKETSLNPYAFINPKRRDCHYPFYDLSSGALAFKVLQVLKPQAYLNCLDLVALSIVCDVVPLRGENRILLKNGLKSIRKTTRPGIQSLCKIAKIKQENITTYHLGFILGPRINAAGRIADAKEALDIFLNEDISLIDGTVEKLQKYNNLRKDLEKDILKQVQLQLDTKGLDDPAIVVWGDDWHHGVLGIIAGRLVNKYYKPSFVFSFSENIGKGSARSIDGIHLMQILGSCANHLPEYGGHRKAAGLSIERENLVIFKDTVNEYIKKNIDPKDLLPVLDIDAKLDFKDITMQFIQELENLAPFGEGNRSPIFASFNLVKKGEAKKINSFYVFWLTDNNHALEVICSDSELIDIFNYGQKFDIVYSLETNTYHNTARLILKDIRLSEE